MAVFICLALALFFAVSAAREIMGDESDPQSRRLSLVYRLATYLLGEHGYAALLLRQR